MIFKKDKLYSKLRERDSWTYAQLLDLKDDIPDLRVKTIDAKGKVPVIQISGSDPWVKPLEWMELHRDEIKRKFQELHQRLSYMGCDPGHEFSVSQGQDETSDELQANDLRVKLERVQHALSDEVKKRVDLNSELEAKTAEIDDLKNLSKALLDTINKGFRSGDLSYDYIRFTVDNQRLSSEMKEKIQTLLLRLWDDKYKLD